MAAVSPESVTLEGELMQAMTMSPFSDWEIYICASLGDNPTAIMDPDVSEAVFLRAVETTPR